MSLLVGLLGTDGLVKPATGLYSLSTAIPFESVGNTPSNIVEVSIQVYPLNSMAPLSGTVVTPLRSTSPASVNAIRDVLGGYPAGVHSVSRCGEPDEQPHSGPAYSVSGVYTRTFF